MLTRTLSNGLRLNVFQSGAARRAAVAVHVGAGFRHERPGQEALAHLVEHLMYEGGHRYSRTDFLDFLRGCAGHADATTHQEYTEFTSVVPTHLMPDLLEFEVDRFTSPHFTDEAVQRHVQGIAAEVASSVEAKGDWPWPRLPRSAWTDFANTHDGFGESGTLEAATPDLCAEFFASAYQAANVTVTVCSPVEDEQVADLLTSRLSRWQTDGTPPSQLSASSVRPGLTRGAGVAPVSSTVVGKALSGPAADLDGYLATLTLAQLMQRHGQRAGRSVAVGCGLFGPLDCAGGDLLIAKQSGRSRAAAEEFRELATEVRSPDPAELAVAVAAVRAHLLAQAQNGLDRVVATAGRLMTLGLPPLPEIVGRLAAVDARAVDAASARMTGCDVIVADLNEAPVTAPARAEGPVRLPLLQRSPRHGWSVTPPPVQAWALPGAHGGVVIDDRLGAGLEVRLAVPLQGRALVRGYLEDSSLRSAAERLGLFTRLKAAGGPLTWAVDSERLLLTGRCGRGALTAWLSEIRGWLAAIVASEEAPSSPAPDPTGRLRWRVESFRTADLATCLQRDPTPVRLDGAVGVVVGRPTPDDELALAELTRLTPEDSPPVPAIGGPIVQRRDTVPVVTFGWLLPRSRLVSETDLVACNLLAGTPFSRLGSPDPMTVGAGTSLSAIERFGCWNRVTLRCCGDATALSEFVEDVYRQLDSICDSTLGEMEVGAVAHYTADYFQTAFDSPQLLASVVCDHLFRGSDFDSIMRLDWTLRQVRPPEVGTSLRELFGQSRPTVGIVGSSHDVGVLLRSTESMFERHETDRKSPSEGTKR